VRSEAQVVEGEAGPSERRAQAIQRRTSQAIEPTSLKSRLKVRQRSEPQVTEGETVPSKLKANVVCSEAKAVEGEAGKPKPKDKLIQRSEMQAVESVTSKANPQVVQRSEAQAAKGQTGLLEPKANVVAGANLNLSTATAHIAAEGHAKSSKPKTNAQTTPRIKKVKIVPRPWRAPEARMV
jgi:hypothetical protein